MSKFLRSFAFVVICNTAFLVGSQSQTAAVIPANEAAAHVGEYATVEGVVAKVFTSKSGTLLNIGAAYPNQTFTGWIPPSSPVAKSPMLSGIEGKHVKITGRIEMYKGKPEIRINAAEQLARGRIKQLPMNWQDPDSTGKGASRLPARLAL